MIDGPFERAHLAAGDAGADEVQAVLAQPASRRRVSSKWALPPSTTMSPSSSCGTSSSMTASVGAPALTMIDDPAGAFQVATNSSMVVGRARRCPPCRARP